VIRARLRPGLLLAIAAFASAFPGCARSVFPPGGPIDTVPPRVTASSPGDSVTSFPADASVEILFSEAMDRASVVDGIRIYPPPGREDFTWDGRRLRIEWDRPLAPATTYILLVSGTARDARGVRMGSPFTIRFSTGTAIDSGRVSGVLRTRTLRRQTVPILAFYDTLGARPDTLGIQASYATETDTAGAYSLTGLPVNRGFTIHALFDLNQNGAIDPEGDLIASYASAIRLTPERSGADSINITAVDPRAPAVLNGTIATQDSTGRFRIEAQETVDSSLVRRVERVGPGGFTLRVPSGTYRLRATLLPPPESMQRDQTLQWQDPIHVEPEEEYGPFEFTFGTVGTRPPREDGEGDDEE
jgi:hypothetical protein